MFLICAAAIDTSRRKVKVTNLYRKLNMLGTIKPSVILNSYNVYSVTYTDRLNVFNYSQVAQWTSCSRLYTGDSRNLK